mmetsp:Transcript_31086/g.73896  ORF Transcript_31086/g.73896 Transcript_31086/m.73896 type:complete len:218 (+) Transcript_31086:1582-2235(+)
MLLDGAPEVEHSRPGQAADRDLDAVPEADEGPALHVEQQAPPAPLLELHLAEHPAYRRPRLGGEAGDVEGIPDRGLVAPPPLCLGCDPDVPPADRAAAYPADGDGARGVVRVEVGEARGAVLRRRGVQGPRVPAQAARRSHLPDRLQAHKRRRRCRPLPFGGGRHCRRLPRPLPLLHLRLPRLQIGLQPVALGHPVPGLAAVGAYLLPARWKGAAAP